MGHGMMRCAVILAVLVSGCGGSEFTASVADGGGGGGLDSSPGADGGATWCMSRPTPPSFCADFDETTDIATVVSAWSDGEAGNGTRTVVGDLAAPSLPNVLTTTAAGSTAFAKSGAITLGETLNREEVIRTVHVETAIRLDQGKVAGDLDSATFLGLFYAGNTLFLALVKPPAGSPSGTGGGLTFGIQGAGDAGSLNFGTVPGTLTEGQWAGSFAIDLDVGNSKAKISHDGTDVLDVPVPPPAQTLQSATMAIGVVTFGVTGTVGFSFDNVRMDVN